MYTIDSNFQLGGKLQDFDEKIVKDEPMLFSCDVANAWVRGGPITRNFLETFFGGEDQIPFKDKGYCMDSRVHMLMPDWWPCIPGWHHDDVPRSRPDGQPNYATPEYHSKHCLALVNGEICPTEFAVGKVDMPHVDGTVYEEWTKIVDDKVFTGELMKTRVPSNRLVYFDCESFHQGTKAVKRGWRWFGRISWDAGYEEGRPHFNETRKQVNVYMDKPMKGW